MKKSILLVSLLLAAAAALTGCSHPTDLLDIACAAPASVHG